MTLDEYRALIAKEKKEPKYKNKITFVDGIKFDSKAEAKRYMELKFLESAGRISNLQRQVRYQIVVNNMKITTYIADFVYTDDKGHQVVEDQKGGKATMTPLYRVKKKLMKAVHGIDIKEVTG